MGVIGDQDRTGFQAVSGDPDIVDRQQATGFFEVIFLFPILGLDLFKFFGSLFEFRKVFFGPKSAKFGKIGSMLETLALGLNAQRFFNQLQDGFIDAGPLGFGL